MSFAGPHNMAAKKAQAKRKSVKRKAKTLPYFIYILKCADGTLYTGSTSDIEKRVHAHNNLKSAAKYTRSRRPVELGYFEKFKSKSEALKREAALKKLTREAKLELVAGPLQNNAKGIR